MRITCTALAAAALVALSVSSSCAQSAGGLLTLEVDNGGTPFAGDGPSVVTVSPNGDGYRDAAVIRYRLGSSATVRFGIATHGAPARGLADAGLMSAGEHTYRWSPPATPVPASYLVHVTAAGVSANIVVHVQGVDAAAGRAAYHPGDSARIAVGTDARGFFVDVLRITGAAPTTRRNDKVQGTPMGPAFHVRWAGHGDRPHTLAVPLGAWRSGVYFVRLRADDGRVGYAPIVLRPHRLGQNRVAVVLPTYTWQAYDFFDRDGDGRGDTWYAGWRRETAHLGRPYLNRGVPAHFNTYDLPFLRWAARRDLHADFLSDADLASIGSGDELARLYDFVVFPGHHEYATESEYDVVTRYRDLGGNLAWLSANNFFWKIVRHGPIMRRIATWRRLGRPEAALLGVQYRGNDEGQRRGPMVVGDDAAAKWLFDDTGLQTGAGFGNFGIEIDARAASSPPQTHVVASVSDLYGPGMTAEMTYYETDKGAKVFAAGAFTLAGLSDSHVGAQILANLFSHLEQP